MEKYIKPQIKVREIVLGNELMQVSGGSGDTEAPKDPTQNPSGNPQDPRTGGHAKINFNTWDEE